MCAVTVFFSLFFDSIYSFASFRNQFIFSSHCKFCRQHIIIIYCATAFINKSVKFIRDFECSITLCTLVTYRIQQNSIRTIEMSSKRNKNSKNSSTPGLESLAQTNTSTAASAGKLKCSLRGSNRCVDTNVFSFSRSLFSSDCYGIGEQ